MESEREREREREKERGREREREREGKREKLISLVSLVINAFLSRYDICIK